MNAITPTKPKANSRNKGCEWRSVNGFPDYAVSSQGVVMRITPVKRKTEVPYVIKGIKDGNYVSVNLMTPSGKPKKIAVHRVVCAAFNGPPLPGKPLVAHFDGNGNNNCADNLRWASQKENLQDRDRHGTDQKGENANGARLNWAIVSEIRNRFSGVKGEQTSLAGEFGITAASVHDIVRGKTWKCQ